MSELMSSMTYSKVAHLLRVVVKDTYPFPNFSSNERRVKLAWDIHHLPYIICKFYDEHKERPAYFSFKSSGVHLEGPIDHTMETHFRNFLARTIKSKL
jgi:hypothetical protein